MRACSGLGEPGSVVVNALGQALRLSGADVTMTNVTVLGGLDVRNSASLTRVIVDSSGFDRTRPKPPPPKPQLNHFPPQATASR
jgi:hypothetical protein